MAFEPRIEKEFRRLGFSSDIPNLFSETNDFVAEDATCVWDDLWSHVDQNEASEKDLDKYWNDCTLFAAASVISASILTLAAVIDRKNELDTKDAIESFSETVGCGFRDMAEHLGDVASSISMIAEYMPDPSGLVNAICGSKEEKENKNE